jgi:hypothetical protein
MTGFCPQGTLAAGGLCRAATLPQSPPLSARLMGPAGRSHVRSTPVLHAGGPHSPEWSRWLVGGPAAGVTHAAQS